VSPNSSIRTTIGGRELSISNLDKVLYPATGFTKGQVIDYYVRIADAMLPHIAIARSRLSGIRTASTILISSKSTYPPMPRTGSAGYTCPRHPTGKPSTTACV